MEGPVEIQIFSREPVAAARLVLQERAASAVYPLVVISTARPVPGLVPMAARTEQPVQTASSQWPVRSAARAGQAAQRGARPEHRAAVRAALVRSAVAVDQADRTAEASAALEVPVLRVIYGTQAKVPVAAGVVALVATHQERARRALVVSMAAAAAVHRTTSLRLAAMSVGRVPKALWSLVTRLLYPPTAIS
jgi:hypothetical protein